MRLHRWMVKIPLFSLDLCSHCVYDLLINQVYPQYIPWDDSFQTVKIKKLETHTTQSNLPFIYQAGYELKIA